MEAIMGPLGDILNGLVKRGDHILVHTAAGDLLRALGCTPDDVIAELQTLVGQSGALIFPTFNWGWLNGECFDDARTPSQMGVVTEVARKLSTVRSGHPVYSFCALGADVEEYAIDNASAYGPSSPFTVLEEHDAKVLIINMPWTHAMTAFHWVEECNRVPYRFYKRFTGDYIARTDAGRRVSQTRDYFMYVRRISQGVVTNVGHVEPAMIEKRLASKVELANIPMTLVSIREFRNFVEAGLNANPSYLHTINEPSGQDSPGN